jgi:2-polyprenyl-6-methoxyphenol hydroxylase-like FAD-dependent oxidoreductase
VCEAELPGLCGRLLAAGCRLVDPLAVLPATIADRDPRPGDTAFRMVAGRRPVVESVFAATAEQQRGVEVRRDVRICELVPGPPAVRGVPHVAGVRTSTGEELRADLVVDAMGRRSRSVAMLAALGARPSSTDAADSGFAYYTRYFTGAVMPVPRALPVMPIGTISVLTLPADNGTWSVTVFTASADAPVKELRKADVFMRVIGACPLQAHWLDGQPVTDVMPTAGILDRYHRFVIDGTPVVTGLVAIGDAWACTNPSAGRGLSVGLESALSRLARTAAADARLYRAYLETLLCLALPQEVLQRPGITEAIERLGQQNPSPPPGPDRRKLLQLLS